MQCSSEEIAEKKRLAQERLKQRKNQQQTTVQQPHQSNSIVKSPTSSFYGNKITEKSTELSNYENKIKNTPSDKTINRILSQPYSSRHTNGQSNTKTSSSSTTSYHNNNNNNNTFKVITGTCSMVSANRFQVVESGYHAKLIEVYKTIPSRDFKRDTKIWSFHLDDYDLLQERVTRLNPQVVIGQLPKFVLNLLRSEKQELDYFCLQAIERKLSEQLLEFQKVGVAFAISNGGRCMIADDMGLGKTFQAIAVADFYKDDWPLLVVTTATAREGWERHFRDLLPWIPSQKICSLTSKDDYFGDAKVLITSYAMMDRYCDRLLEKNFGMIILDESHMIKNFKTKCTQSATKLGEKAKRVILLTGTPALSRPSELYCQLSMIDKKFFGNFKEYSLRYCNGKMGPFGLESNGQSNLAELNVILSRKFMIRRTKEEVEFELGAKSRETILLDPSAIWNTKDDSMREALENMQEYSSDIMKLKGTQRDEVLLRFYAETAKLKANAVCAYAKGLVREKKKFIIFGYHKVMLNALCACLTKLKADFIRIDGSTRSDLRTEYIDRFQKKQSCQVAVLSLKACNAAITLTSASLVIFAELDWNPSTLAQCESRAHRIGQKSPVTCRYLLAKGTADDYIWEMVKKKQDVLNKAGLFSEDLSNATHSAAPMAEVNTLTQYYVPVNESDAKEGECSTSNQQKEEPMETSTDDTDYKCLLDDDEADAALLDLDF